MGFEENFPSKHEQPLHPIQESLPHTETPPITDRELDNYARDLRTESRVMGREKEGLVDLSEVLEGGHSAMNRFTNQLFDVKNDVRLSEPIRAELATFYEALKRFQGETLFNMEHSVEKAKRDGMQERMSVNHELLHSEGETVPDEENRPEGLAA